MRIYTLIGLLYVNMVFPVLAETAPEGLITLNSAHSVSVTMQRLQTIVESKQLQVFGLIDHAAGAEQAGLELPPNALLIFGSPKIGTALMQCNPRLGIELPLKVQVWEEADGAVRLAYQDPQHLATQYQLGECGAAVVTKMRKALQAFTHHAVAIDKQGL